VKARVALSLARIEVELAGTVSGTGARAGMTGIGGDGPGRETETPSFSEAASIEVSQIAKVAAVTVDLRDGFRNARRSPEYRAIHGLSPDVNDTREDWIARLHPEDRTRTVQHG
jgi:hypothetical protein